MRLLTVGKVARRARVGVETVRFYEKIGLLEEPARMASGYRVYDEETVKRLLFIQRAKDIGFTLNEVRELLSLRGAERPCPDVRERAEAKIREIEAKVAMLLRMKEALSSLASSCGSRGDNTGCLILDTLDGQETPAGRGNDGGNNDSPLSRQQEQGQEGRHGDAAIPRAGRVSKADRRR